MSKAWALLAVWCCGIPQALLGEEIAADKDPRKALATMYYELPIDVGLAFPPIRKEVGLTPAEEAAVAGEIAARERRIAKLVALLHDVAVPEPERALQISSACTDPAYALAAHQGRLRTALGAGAKRWEQLQRQLEGPIGAFAESRRAELGIGNEQARRALAELPKWHKKVQWVEGNEFRRPGEPHDSLHQRYLDERQALARDIERQFDDAQKAAWNASLGKPYDFGDLAPFAGNDIAGDRPYWGGPVDQIGHSKVRSRPLQMAALRQWLGLTDQEQARIEELQIAADATRDEMAEFCRRCTRREAYRLRDAWERSRLHSLVHDRQVWAAMPPAKAHQAQAIFYRCQGTPVLTWGCPLRAEFGIDNEESAGAKAFRRACKKFEGEMAERAKTGKPDMTRDDVVRCLEDHLLAELPKNLADRWREMAKIDPPMPPELVKEWDEFFGNSKPREPYVPKAPAK